VPEQDNGLLWGGIQGDQSLSLQLMGTKLAQFVDIMRQDPAVARVTGFCGGGSYGSAFIVLRPLSERLVSAAEIANRLRGKLDHIAGATLYWGRIRIFGSVRVQTRPATSTRCLAKTPTTSTNGHPRPPQR